MTNSKDKEKIIMYDSPEAGRLVTVTVWEVDNPNGIIYTPIEKSARYNNCTHKVCECGKPMPKYYIKCDTCRHKAATERYNALPFKEWNGEPVVTRDGDKYFFDEDDLIEFCEENEMEAIDLLFCKENHYNQIDGSCWSDNMPEDEDIPDELQKALDTVNDLIKTLPPQSYSPGKIRTHYIRKLETNEQ